jgi:putative cardiolipin synthase
VLRTTLIEIALCAAFTCLGCTSVPRPVAREPSAALTHTADTTLGRAIAADLAAHPRESIFYPLPLGTEAFAARLALIRAAGRSIDAQYYVVHDDDTGRALLAEMLHAADRGVRVRLLLDDIHTGGEDTLLAALDAHPHFEVRVFNPFHYRSARWLDFTLRFSHVNRRMHNKSLTADNQLTIVGGRNIGDEYFAAHADLDFSDLDVLAGGPIVPHVSDVFDRYWNNEVAYPMGAMVSRAPDEATIDAQRAGLEHSLNEMCETEYARALADLELVHAIREKRLELYWGAATLIADPPEKVTQPPDESMHAMAKLKELLSAAQHELILVSPYFVPGEPGTEWLAAIAKRGVRVRLLTNSFTATDVKVVHAGYMTYRSRLLEAGVEIYEMKPNAYSDLPKSESHSVNIGSSRSSLHAKTYVVDGDTIFIGSLNLDPRSVIQNTEMGLALECPPLVERFTGRFDANILGLAYRVELQGGALTWTTREAGREVVLNSEPGVGFFRSLGLFLQQLLPIEKQL